MKVKLIDNIIVIEKLRGANIPNFIIDEMLLKPFDCDIHGNVEVMWNGKVTAWSVPSDCLCTSTAEPLSSSYDKTATGVPINSYNRAPSETSKPSRKAHSTKKEQQ